MQMTKTQKIIISIVVVAVLAGGYIILDRRSKTGTTDVVSNATSTTETNSTSTSTMTDGKIHVQTSTGGYTIEQVPINEGKNTMPEPDLNKPTATYPGAIIAPEARAAALVKIQSTSDILKKNSTNQLAWVDLGIYQKQAGDYNAAILSWKYASYLAPTDFVPLANIGNLYAYYIKDNAQAEIYYKQAIAKAPTQAYIYVQLAEVYRDIFQDKAKALAIINQGLAKIPNDPLLLQAKATVQ